MTTIVQTQDYILVSVLAVLSYYIIQLYTDLSTCSTVLLHHTIVYLPYLIQYCILFSTTFALVLYFLYYHLSMITRLYRIHGHVCINHATFPGTYTPLIYYLIPSPITYLRTVLPLTLPGYVDVIIQIRHWIRAYNYDSNLLIHP